MTTAPMTDAEKQLIEQAKANMASQRIAATTMVGLGEGRVPSLEELGAASNFYPPHLITNALLLAILTHLKGA